MLVEHEIVARLERAFAADIVAVARSHRELVAGSSASFLEIGAGAAVVIGQGSALNRVLGAWLDGEPVDQDELAGAEQLMEDAGVASEIQLTSWAPEGVLEILGDRGYRAAWIRPTYVRTLDRYAHERDTGPMGRLVVEEVGSDPDLFAEWRDLHLEVFAPDDEIGRRAAGEFCTAVHAIPGAHDFVASIDGRTVAICSMILRDRRAWLGGMATRGDSRRLGIQAALIKMRLDRAREAGCDVAVTTANPGTSSGRNIERLGFTSSYSILGLRKPRAR
jgi:GNAT superfamily N-acetyltransferase